jgi:hypothetical protein
VVKLVAGAGALVVVLLAGAWVVAAGSGSLVLGQLVAVAAALAMAAVGLLYAFELGTRPASSQADR